MSWIDIAILGLVVLFGLFGVLRGVKKSALSLGAFVVAFLLAFFLAHVVAEALLGIEGVKSFVLGSNLGSNEFSLANWLYMANKGVEPSAETSSKYLMTNFYEPILAIMNKSTVQVAQDQGLAIYGAFLIFSTLCGVGIFIVARFLLIIVTAIIKSYMGKKKSVLARLFGFVVGAIEGGVIALAVAIAFTSVGGYTFLTPVANIGNEFETSVFGKYINDAAYGMRNMMLPDSDAYGRLVNMVVKTDNGNNTDEEKLSGKRLELYIALANVDYEATSNPWSIDENRKRKFDVNVAVRRDYREFDIIDFDDVAKALLDYNQAVWHVVDDTSKMHGADFNALCDLVQKSDANPDASIIDKLMNDLWVQLREYKDHYIDPDPAAEPSVQTSTLASDYAKITETINKIKVNYGQFDEYLAEDQKLDSVLPELPAAKTEPNAGAVDPWVTIKDIPLDDLDNIPKSPETPETPENPGGDENPETPENPGGGETPETPENPGGDENPETPETSGGDETEITG